MQKFYNLYIVLLALVPLTPRFDATDNVITHYLSLGLVAFFGLILVFFKNSKSKIRFSYTSAPIFFYFGFFIISLLSLFFAINQVESLIALSKIVLFLIHLYIFYSLELYKIISQKLILFLIVGLLLAESVASIYPVFEILSFTDYKLEFANDYLKGFAGNKNITAASLIMKLPFVFILYNLTQKKLLKYVLITISILVTTNLFFLGSRASFISLFIVFGGYILYLIYQNTKKFELSYLKKYIHLPIILIISYLLFSTNVATDDQGTLTNRVSSVITNDLDESSSQRLRFYKQAIVYSIENPLMGGGIGNWKIISVDLDKEYITSYIVPYVLHNDFLEILGETNLIGFIFYFSFFISLFYLCFKSYNSSDDSINKIKFLLISFAFFSYFIDSMLNFPLYRAIMQVSLLLSTFYLLNASKQDPKIANE